MVKLTNHVSMIKEKKEKKRIFIHMSVRKNNYFVFLILTK